MKRWSINHETTSPWRALKRSSSVSMAGNDSHQNYAIIRLRQQHAADRDVCNPLRPIKRLKLYLRTRRGMPARIHFAVVSYTCDRRSEIAPVTVRKLFRERSLTLAARPRYTAAIGEYIGSVRPDRRNAHEWRVKTTCCASRVSRVPAGNSRKILPSLVIGAVGTCFRTARGDLSRCRWAAIGRVTFQPQIFFFLYVEARG